MLLDKPYFLKNKKWYIENKETPKFLGGKTKRQYTLTDKAPKKAIDSYYEYYKMIEENVLVDKKQCACCGKYTLDKDDMFDVCSVCGWQQDKVQEQDPNYSGGANEKSLNEYKKKT